MTTFAEIHAARLALDRQLDQPTNILPFVPEAPSWQQTNVRHRADDAQVSGMLFQQCGGGRRVIRKKVSGGNY